MIDELYAPRTRLVAFLDALVGTSEFPKLKEALTHPSYGNETGAPDNQRLEFLGDAVLALCVSELLAETHPSADEGLLTRMRSALVNADALALWARAVQLGDCLALGRGARASEEARQTNVLSDAVEAVVAAVYERCGLDGARALVREIVREPMADLNALGGLDPKSALQERVQAEGLPTPVYRVVTVGGPLHHQQFEVAVFVGEEELGRGEGRSKRLAERAAAQSSLQHLAQKL